MRTRILIFSAEGAPLMGLDVHGDVERARSMLESNLAALAREGHGEPIVVAFDPLTGKDDALDAVRSMHRIRVDHHVRPDGAREIHGLVLHAADARGVVGSREPLRESTAFARALRVLRAPSHIANPRQPLRGTR